MSQFVVMAHLHCGVKFAFDVIDWASEKLIVNIAERIYSDVGCWSYFFMSRAS
jgi:hypothetical protein